MAGTQYKQHFLIVFFDEVVAEGVGKIYPRDRPPMPEQSILYVLGF
jgi:hypothetical protein